MNRLFAVVALGVVVSTGCGGAAEQGDAGPPAQGAATPAPAANPGTNGASASDQRAGQAVFGRTCATCHQQNGRGIAGVYPPLENSPIVAGEAATLIQIVLHGLQGPITVHGRTYNSVMPPWKSLSDADIAAVLTYVRTTWGAGATAVPAELVTSERARTAARTTMWTAGELGL